MSVRSRDREKNGTNKRIVLINKMAKRILIKAAVLIPIFVAALLFFNRKFYNADETEILQMEEPTFPTLSFSLGDCEINNIVGYAQQMDIPSVRDTIVPTDGRHTCLFICIPTIIL